MRTARDLTTTICVPPTTFARNVDGSYTISRFFYDTTGTPYSDLFLSQPAMTGTCAQVTAKALKFTQFTTAHGTTEGVWPIGSHLNVIHQNLALGQLTNGDWTNLSTLTDVPTDPLAVNPFVDPNVAGKTYTIPRTMIQLVGKDANRANLTTTICVPPTTFARNVDGSYTISRFFYDTTGTPYSDLFLSQPAMTGTCAQVTAKALKFTQFTTAHGTTEGVWPIGSHLNVIHQNLALGQLTNGDWTNLSTLTDVPTDPLAVNPFVDPNVAGKTYTIPRTMIQLVGKDANRAEPDHHHLCAANHLRQERRWQLHHLSLLLRHHRYPVQ